MNLCTVEDVKIFAGCDFTFNVEAIPRMSGNKVR